jgi:DNA (cytosine-5)-methyltransferase 1
MASELNGVDVNLFAGAGGFARGLIAAGFAPTYLYEIDATAQQTLRRNKLLVSEVDGWSDHKGDVCKVDWTKFPLPVRLLAAGVPCQPFSLAGNHRADKDGRNHFPELVRAIRILSPAAVIAENVQGLLRQGFRTYFDYILRAMGSPSLAPKSGELWRKHNQRLKQHANRRNHQPEYDVSWALLNAADYGVAQLRRRVFIVATKRGSAEFEFPKPTHSKDALIRSLLSGAYWRERDLRKPSDLETRFPILPANDGLRAWVTVRDVIRALPRHAESEQEALENGSVANHWAIAGARTYAGHTGSDRDWPAKTIKAGVHGVPGGENTVRLGPKRVRYLTLREAACIQSFPVNHVFVGTRLHVTKQIGNAVPPILAEAVAKSLLTALARKVR